MSEALACEGRRGVYMNPSTYTSAVQTVSTAVSNTLPSTVPCVFEVFGGAAPEVLQLPPRRCCSSLRAAGALRAPRRHREKSRHGRLATLFPHTGWSQLLSKEAQRGAAIEILNRVDGEVADREAARLRSASG